MAYFHAAALHLRETARLIGDVITEPCSTEAALATPLGAIQTRRSAEEMDAIAVEVQKLTGYLAPHPQRSQKRLEAEKQAKAQGRQKPALPGGRAGNQANARGSSANSRRTEGTNIHGRAFRNRPFSVVDIAEKLRICHGMVRIPYVPKPKAALPRRTTKIALGTTATPLILY